jgi:hypothetical protein
MKAALVTVDRILHIQYIYLLAKTGNIKSTGKKITDKDKKIIFKWLWQEKTVKILAVQLASACQSHFLTKLKITQD